MNSETIAAQEQISKPADGKSELNAGLGAWYSIDSYQKGHGEHVLAYFPSMRTIFQCWQREDGAWVTGFGERLDNPTHWQPANAPNVKVSGCLQKDKQGTAC